MDPGHQRIQPYVGIQGSLRQPQHRHTGSVCSGDGSVTQIKGNGTMLFSCKNREHQSLPNIYYLPRLTANIIFVGQLDECGYQVLVEDGFMRIRDEERHLLAKIHRSPGRLYVLDVTIARLVCLVVHTDDDAWTWYARFGHTNFVSLNKMAREELARGCPFSIRWSRIARPAMQASNVERRSLKRHSGVPRRCSSFSTGSCPITPATPSGNQYFLLLIDDFSRYMWISLVPSKDAAVMAIKHIQAMAECKTGKIGPFMKIFRIVTHLV